MNKAYKYRLYPDEEHVVLINKTFGCVRFVYNKMLAERKLFYELYRDEKETLKQQRYLLPADYKKEYEWLSEVDSLALANAQLNLNAAYQNFFRNPATGFPKFKSKHHDKKSYTTNNQKGAKLHEKVANQRKDFLHKTSRQITNAYEAVAVFVSIVIQCIIVM